MHGKVWMFSHLIDDEDIEFMQHEFISYRQAMDYYNLGYKKEKPKMVKFTNQTSVEEEKIEEVYISNFKKSQKQTSRSPENKLQGIQLMKVTFLGLPTENVLLSVVVMGAVILICFGISVKCFKVSGK